MYYLSFTSVCICKCVFLNVCNVWRRHFALCLSAPEIQLVWLQLIQMEHSQYVRETYTGKGEEPEGAYRTLLIFYCFDLVFEWIQQFLMCRWRSWSKCGGAGVPAEQRGLSSMPALSCVLLIFCLLLFSWWGFAAITMILTHAWQPTQACYFNQVLFTNLNTHCLSTGVTRNSTSASLYLYISI